MSLIVDRRFGTYNKFGTTNKFGASTLDTGLLWGVEIDWDGDGVFDGSNDGKYMRGLRLQRGRTRYIALEGGGFEKIQTGMAYITLDNNDGRYDGWNTASPLYPNVDFGKDVRIKVRNYANGIIYSVFYGIIQDIQPQVNVDGDALVVLTVADGFSYLRNYNANYAMQQNIAPGVAMGYVLDSVDWPARWGRNLDTGSDTIRYWWASGNQTASSVLEDISNSFVGYFFIAADGRATYVNRSNVSDSVESLTEDVLLKDFSIPQPWQNFRNVTRIKAHPRTQAATGTIWQLLGTVPSLSTGAANALTIFANYTYNAIAGPAINVINPVATTDFLVNSQSDGLGTNLTASCTVVLTDFGETGKLVITNNSGSTGYITLLKIRGDAIYEQNVSDVIYPTTLPSAPRRFVLDLLWQQDINVAVDFSNIIGPFLSTSHPYPIVQIESRHELQFAPDLFNLLSLTTTKYGILGDSFRVAGIEHETLNETCQAVRTKFYLEPYISGENYWVWDTASDFDTTAIFGA